eukprot:842847-Rhodomonas_salina.1
MRESGPVAAALTLVLPPPPRLPLLHQRLRHLKEALVDPPPKLRRCLPHVPTPRGPPSASHVTHRQRPI